jgi:uncharacterized RDD family membrane protein YckC
VGWLGKGGAVTEVSQGPGWWLASDARWYPPHLHPSVVQAPSPPPPPPPPVPYPYGYGPPGGYGAPAAGDRLDPGQVRDEQLALVLAPWWKRFVAILVDSMILALGYFVAIAVIVAAAGHHGASSTSTAPAAPLGAGGVVLAIVVGYVLFSLPLALYYGIMNGSRRGQTLGKMALGIAVRDARTGQRLGFWRGLGRYLITIVFAVLLLVPYLLDNLSPLWNGRNQAWHDRVAHSVVVDLGPRPALTPDSVPLPLPAPAPAPAP